MEMLSGMIWGPVFTPGKLKLADFRGLNQTTPTPTLHSFLENDRCLIFLGSQEKLKTKTVLWCVKETFKYSNSSAIMLHGALANN